MTRHRKHSHTASPAAADPSSSSANPAALTLEDALIDTNARIVPDGNRPSVSKVTKRSASHAAVAADARSDATTAASTKAATTTTATSTGTTAAIKESVALREELKQFALMFDLKPRRRPRAPKVDIDPFAHSTLTFRQLAQRIAPFIVLVGVLSATAALRTPAPPTLPEALIGGWVTKHPSYADNEIGFLESEISFRLGKKAELVRYPITAMKSVSHADTARLTLTYKTETGPVEMNLRLVSGVRPKVIFDRPEGLVWEHRR